MTATVHQLPGLPPALELPRRGTVAQAKREADDEVMWSVTTIIGILDKPALIPWAVGLTAERVVQNLEGIRYRAEREGAAEAIDYVSRLRWRTDGLLKDSDLGTVAHGLFDEYAISGTRPDVVPELHPDHAKEGTVLAEADEAALVGMLDQFDRFLQEFQPDYLATEVVVYSKEYGYAGQADGFASIGGVPLILDYKTSRKTWTKGGKLRTPYPEVGLQLAAYRHADAAAVWRARRYENRSRRYYLLSPAEREMALPVPEVEDGVAIRVTPDHLGVYPVRCGARQWDAFLYCLEVARWSFNEASQVVGNPMPPLFPRAAEGGDPFAGLPTD